ncbi:DegT/DnrJ/EryC1/StrS aminotransferase [Candidatus Koribacter versatilis Ellin345]|uniref:DegT/DnrJ/EryC1/StrS aminotransferase n=1 Tax=Koribacter versatilis (strain Ellin345) TaxID=204669 RepID=Q1IJY2_KORVE|nr:DegT/DnrJ/EryC1/StrS aminotransferase family protein [Candidatus Koribacter versatilis]ABF42818.1 DegT/DnrJ/EryC1/StrS aminotransferase [Candidatus Koribacter versatilis Ellin345]
MYRNFKILERRAPHSVGEWPSFDEEDIRSVESVLRSGRINYWTGEECRRFEREYATHVGTKHAIALTNGTVALELALRALGIGPGDEVITSARTFIASASCAVAVGATPIIADVDRDSQNITADTIRKVVTPKTKAIIAVHLAGWPCEMDSILALAAEYGLKVVEDCAQANGARYKGQVVGSIGDVGAFSFCQDKIITTGGEGGLITLNDDEMWKFAWAYKDHGKSYEAVYNRDHPPGYRWLHESFGTNWRMTEMQGALGRNALRRLDSWVKTRRQNASTLKKAFAGIRAVRIPEPPQDFYHSYYKFYAFIEPHALKPEYSRDRIVQEISELGYPCFVGSCSEIYLEKAFEAAGYRGEILPVARELGDTSLMFLVHPTINESQMDEYADISSRVLRSASR